MQLVRIATLVFALAPLLAAGMDLWLGTHVQSLSGVS